MGDDQAEVELSMMSHSSRCKYMNDNMQLMTLRRGVPVVLEEEDILKSTDIVIILEAQHCNTILSEKKPCISRACPDDPMVLEQVNLYLHSLEHRGPALERAVMWMRSAESDSGQESSDECPGPTNASCTLRTTGKMEVLMRCLSLLVAMLDYPAHTWDLQRWQKLTQVLTKFYQAWVHVEVISNPDYTLSRGQVMCTSHLQLCHKSSESNGAPPGFGAQNSFTGPESFLLLRVLYLVGWWAVRGQRVHGFEMGYTGWMRSQSPSGPRGVHRASVHVLSDPERPSRARSLRTVCHAAVGLVAQVANRLAEGGVLRTGILSGATSAGRFRIACAVEDGRRE
ncbi:hypothetical protein O3P69_020263 [Scylla paramamosain]|uniref:Uncharacterized protein n=1 Tax=Scylla paramamosain TaxID=85552 RepID=A0AAW0TKJ1_SCYPA